MTDRTRETTGETEVRDTYRGKNPQRAARRRRDDNRGGENDSTVSAEERRRMVAEAAYFRAACRDFAPGGEFRDWIEAEAEIKRLLSSDTSGQDRHNITRR